MLFFYLLRISAHSYTEHAATLTTKLEQSSDSTKVTFSLVGVPKGQEDEIKRNIEGY